MKEGFYRDCNILNFEKFFNEGYDRIKDTNILNSFIITQIIDNENVYCEDVIGNVYKVQINENKDVLQYELIKEAKIEWVVTSNAVLLLHKYDKNIYDDVEFDNTIHKLIAIDFIDEQLIRLYIDTEYFTLLVKIDDKNVYTNREALLYILAKSELLYNTTGKKFVEYFIEYT